MRIKMIAATGALAAGLFATSAFAAWDGVYAGGSISWIDAEEQLTSDEWAEPSKGDGDGFGLGLFWGYNIQKGNVVMGVEGDIAFASADSKQGDWDGASVETDIDTVAHLRSRLGYAFGAFLPYVSVGVALAQTETSLVNGSDVDNFDATRAGLSYGLGVEWAAQENLRARLEYVRDEYGNEGFGSYDAFGDSAFGTLETDTITLGLVYGF